MTSRKRFKLLFWVLLAFAILLAIGGLLPRYLQEQRISKQEQRISKRIDDLHLEGPSPEHDRAVEAVVKIGSPAGGSRGTYITKGLLPKAYPKAGRSKLMRSQKHLDNLFAS